MPDITVIAHNIRSTHNVGAIFRSCEGFGIEKIICTGYTPYPDLGVRHDAPACAYIDGELTTRDRRLPHIRDKITSQIHKSALGAEALVPFEYHDQLDLSALKDAGYRIVALEQDSRSIPLAQYRASKRIALLLGEEVEGISAELLEQCDDIIEIPMNGKKESFNVSVAAGIALYALTVI